MRKAQLRTFGVAPTTAVDKASSPILSSIGASFASRSVRAPRVHACPTGCFGSVSFYHSRFPLCVLPNAFSLRSEDSLYYHQHLTRLHVLYLLTSSVSFPPLLLPTRLYYHYSFLPFQFASNHEPFNFYLTDLPLLLRLLSALFLFFLFFSFYPPFL